MKKELRKTPARALPNLKTRLTDIWNSVTIQECKVLVETMHKRLDAVLKQNGDATQCATELQMSKGHKCPKEFCV